ncbi:MAG: RecB family exonuclease, partial [Micromonosporaceae bacterium]
TLALPAVVAELRQVVNDSTVRRPRRAAAARRVARLAAAGVPGAHPDDWWGLRPLSDERPVAEPDETVQLSPSMVEAVQRCGLRWLLERHGGSTPPSVEQTVGNLVHAVAAEAASPDAEPQALYRFLDEHWGVVEVAARWEQGRKRDAAEKMVKRLVDWLAANPRELLGAEKGFRVTLPGEVDGAGGPEVEIVGAVDRIERDADGRLVVIDFKTGKSAPRNGDVASHPQLGTYQLAIALGGFAELAGDPDGTPAEPGGAALVHLGKDRRDGPEQQQPALGEADDPQWADRMVRAAASAMAAPRFTAQVNDYCAICPVSASCPVSEHGRQVIEPAGAGQGPAPKAGPGKPSAPGPGAPAGGDGDD